VSEYKCREYIIDIATLRVGTAIMVDTEIYTPVHGQKRDGSEANAASGRLAPIAPLEEIIDAALQSAKFTANVLAAPRVNAPVGRPLGITR
jgi:hypothetical protein